MDFTASCIALFLLWGTTSRLHFSSASASFEHKQRSSAQFAGPYSNQTEATSLNPRDGKFFPLFTLVRFSNEPCRTTTEENGICYTRPQCTALGGLAAGTCAKGLGVCCQFFSSCGSIVNQNQTFFRNPDFPTKYRPSGSDVCQIRIRKQVNTCQLRLNFIKFDIASPSLSPPPAGGGGGGNTGVESGVCKNDMLTVSAQGAGIPALCGNLDGQHMYLEFGSSETMTLNILLSSNNDVEREWNIEILMIPCRAILRAPAGCLQYYQGLSGTVSSFNLVPGQHLANLGYSICVRVEEGMRSIDWSACQPGEVKISGPTPLPAVQPTTPTILGICSATNAVDYVTIPGGIAFPLPPPGMVQYPTGVASGQSFTDRFCDIYFGYANTFVRSSVKPFILSVRTDGLEAITPMNDASVGFCFKWQQSPNS